MHKTFNHHMDGKRPITVKIHKEHVSFHFNEENDLEFYWFDIIQWNFFKNHMADKTWFSDEMSEFIDDCISEKKKVA